MSVRYLYRVLPASKRVCSYHRCQRPILRNIAKDKNGALYHYGCLQSALDEKHHCVECDSILDGTQVSSCEIDGLPALSCGNCGSTLRMPTNFERVIQIGNL